MAICCVLFALGGAGYLWAYLYLNDEAVARLIMKIVNPTLKGRLEFQSVHWSPRLILDLITGANTPVQIERLRVYDPDDQVVIKVPRVPLHLGLRKLILANTLHIKGMQLKDAWAEVLEKPGPEGTVIGLVEAFTAVTPSPGPGLRVELLDFDVVNADIKLQFVHWALHLKGARTPGSFIVPREEGLLFLLQPKAPAGSLTILGVEVPLKDLDARRFDVTTDNPMDLVTDLVTVGGGAKIHLSGKLIDLFRELSKVDISITAEDAQQFLQSKLGDALAGPGSLTATIKGPLNGPKIKGVLKNFAVGTKEIKASAIGGEVVFDTVKTTIAATRLQGRFLEGTFSQSSADFDLTTGDWKGLIKVNGINAGPWLSVLEGKLDGTVEVKRGTLFPQLGAQTAVDLTLARARRDWLPRTLEIDGQVNFNPAIIDLAGVSITGEGHTLKSRGSVNLSSQAVNLHMALHSGRLAPLLMRRGLPPVVEGGQARLQITGKYPHLRAKGQLKLLDVGYGPLRLDHIDTEVEFKGGTLHFNEILSSNYGGKLEGQAALKIFAGDVTRALRMPTFQAEISAQSLDLTALGTRSIGLIGRLFAELKLSGPLDKLSGTATINLPRVTFQGDSYDGVWARVGLLEDRISVYESRIQRTGGGKLEVKGDLFFDSRLDFRTKVAAFPLAGIPALTGSPIGVSGMISGKVKIGGTVEDPRLEGSLKLAQTVIRGVGLGAGEVFFTPGSDGMRIKGKLLGGICRLDGYILTDPFYRLHLTVEVDRFPIEKLLFEMKQLGEVKGVATGRFRLAVDTMSGLTWADARFTDIQLTMRYRPPGERRARVIKLNNQDDILARYDGKQLHIVTAKLASRVEGEKQRQAEFSVGGWLSGERVDMRLRGRVALEILQFVLSRRIKKITGDARADIALTGPMHNLALSGALRLKGVKIWMNKFDRALQINQAEISLSPGELRLKRLVLDVGKQRMTASGWLSLDHFRPQNIDAKISGDLNLRLLELAFPEQVSSAVGSTQVKLHVTGPVRDPQFAGTMRINRVELTPRGWGRLVTFQSGEVSLTNYLLKIVRPLEGTYDEGMIRIGGEVRLDNWDLADIYLEINGSGIPQREPKVYSAEVNLNVQLMGDSQQLTLEGEVDLVDARYIRNFDIISQAVIKPRIHEEVPPFWKGSPLLENLQMRLKVQSTGQIAVNNNYAELMLSGALEVRGILAEPRLDGQIRVEEGDFRIPFLRGEFTISRGDITFSKKRPVEEAEINITGESLFLDRSGVDYQIKLVLRGPLNQIGIQLSSNPNLDQGQIIVLLASGRTTDQLRSQFGGGAEGQANSSNQAAGAADAQVKQLTGEILAQIFEDPIKKVTQVDLFRFEVGTESAQFRASKKLGRYVNLAGEYELGLLVDDTRAEGRIEVRMSDLLMLVGKWERLSTRLELESQEPNRGRVELKLKLPLR